MKTILFSAALILLLAFISACETEEPVEPDEPATPEQPDSGSVEIEEPINSEDTVKVEIVFSIGF